MKEYTYRVTWSAEDQQHVGLCAELPSLSYLDNDMIGALHGIVGLVTNVLEDMHEAGEGIPAPISG
ncbi:MAG: antitoxin HicB [Pseudomonadota bacterium]